MTHLTTIEPEPIPISPQGFAGEPQLERENLNHQRLHGVLLFIGDCVIAESQRQRPRGYVMRPAPPAKT